MSSSLYKNFKYVQMKVWWRRGELNPSPKIARTMTLHA